MVQDRVQLRRCWQDKASTTSHRRQLMHCPATMQPDCKYVHVQCVQMKFYNTEHETTGAFTAVAVALGLAIKEDWATLCQKLFGYVGISELNSKMIR